MKTRNYKLDVLKMCLIISVIFGHIPLLEGFIDLYLPSDYDFLTMHAMKGIYAFHMPLFVLISGYFTRQQPLRVQFKKSLRLLKLFIVFQVIDILIRHFYGGNIFIRSMAISLFCIVVSALSVLLENTFIGYPAKMESQMDCRNIIFNKYFCRFH